MKIWVLSNLKVCRLDWFLAVVWKSSAIMTNWDMLYTYIQVQLVAVAAKCGSMWTLFFFVITTFKKYLWCLIFSSKFKLVGVNPIFTHGVCACFFCLCLSVEQGLMELRKLNIEHLMWEASRKKVDQNPSTTVHRK